jgi:hypothetical protein
MSYRYAMRGGAIAATVVLLTALLTGCGGQPSPVAIITGSAQPGFCPTPILDSRTGQYDIACYTAMKFNTVCADNSSGALKGWAYISSGKAWACVVPSKYGIAARIAECIYFNGDLVYSDPNVACIRTTPGGNDISLVWVTDPVGFRSQTSEHDLPVGGS